MLADDLGIWRPHSATGTQSSVVLPSIAHVGYSINDFTVDPYSSLLKAFGDYFLGEGTP